MPHEVIMPALGMAQDTGRIVSWLKQPGDPVKAGDALFEVETDKATMEVEAQADGFLTRVSHDAGEDVPVGQVIALISDSPEDSAPAPAPAAEAVGQAEADAPGDAIPEGKAVIMPALGMAQDSGLIVAWHKAPGDAVAAGDILFEVETDKATMDVEAGVDGYVAALLAEAGDAAPVGDTIAIISAGKPEKTLRRARSQDAAAAPASAPAPVAKSDAAPVKKAATKPLSKPAVPAAKAANGRILASPKLRRLALEQGLDLEHLVAAGHPQPYHASDLATLQALAAAPAPSAAAASASRRLTAQIASDGFADFATWAAEAMGTDGASAVLAGLAAASTGYDIAIVAVEGQGPTQTYQVPPGPLGAASLSDDAPGLRVRDLRHSRVSTIELGPEDVPVLSLTRSGAGLTVTLECASDQLSAPAALALLTEFAGRIEQPLRHLL